MLNKSILAWTLFVFCQSALFANDKLTEQQIFKLERGEILLTSVAQQTGKRFQAWVIFPASVEEVRDVLIDFANYPLFMPDIEQTDILSKNPYTVNYTLHLPLGMKKYYRLLHEVKMQDGEIILHWQQIPWPGVTEKDSIKDTKGLWRLSSYKEHKTLVFYDIYTDPGRVPFGFGWIVDYLTKESVPNVLKNTKAYLQNRKFRK